MESLIYDAKNKVIQQVAMLDKAAWPHSYRKSANNNDKSKAVMVYSRFFEP